MSPQNRLKWLLVTQKCKKFPGASPLDPIGGLTAPPNPQLLRLALLVFLAKFVFLVSLALLATLVNISYLFNNEDLHPCLGRPHSIKEVFRNAWGSAQGKLEVDIKSRLGKKF